MLRNFLYMLFLRFTVIKYSTERLPVKGKAHYRPGQTLRLKNIKASRISGNSTHGVGKAVSPTHRNIALLQETLTLRYVLSLLIYRVILSLEAPNYCL
jgi:hypothetical protein